MSVFFKNTFRSILGLSNSDDQQTLRHRNTPIPGGLTLIFTANNIEATATVLQSVAVEPTVSVSDAGNQDPGEMSMPNDDIRYSTAAGDIIPSGTARDAEGGVERFATLTESIGFESLNERAKGGEMMGSPTTTTTEELMARTRTRSRETMPRVRRRQEVTLKNFPPFLSTLNANGRLRFNLSKVRKEGRLQIIQVRNDWPEFVRTSPKEGRLRIQLIDAHQEEEEEEEEESSNEEREDGRGGGGAAANGDGLRRCEESRH